MTGITVPWIAELVLITYRTVKQENRPPLPSELLASFVIFGTVSLLADSQPRIASAFGWGIVVATALNLTPTVVAPRGSGGGGGKVGPVSLPFGWGSSSPAPAAPATPSASGGGGGGSTRQV